MNVYLFSFFMVTTRVSVHALRPLDDDLYEHLVNDPRTQVKTVFTSFAGITTARVSGFVSFVSSCLIIFLVLRSDRKLSTPYHRIMFGMSVTNAMGSLSTFSSTWLMPKEMIYEQFEGAVLGNAATCTAQGFSFFVGANCAFGFNAALCIYYVCIIRYNYTEKMFGNCIERLLYAMVTITALVPSFAMVYTDSFVPLPFDLTCVPGTYPYWCALPNMNGGEECSLYSQIGRSTYAKILQLWVLGTYLMGSAIMFTTMFLVCWTVYSQERRLKIYLKSIHGQRTENNENGKYDDKINTTQLWRSETKTVLFQALGYLGAFLLCQLFPLWYFLLIPNRNPVLLYLQALFRPLQGLFNCMIYIGHKISNRRRSNSTLTKWQAFRQIFTRPNDDPTLFIHNINIVFKEGDGDNSMMNVSFSEVKDGLYSRNTKDADAFPSGISFGPPASELDKSNIVNSVSLPDLNYDSQAKGSFGFVERNVFNEDHLQESKLAIRESKSKASSSGISWFSRESGVGSRDISHAVSSLG